MEKIYIIKELDCAHCAEKMERVIGKIKGVDSASINFMTQKLIIEANESEFERIIEEANKACKKIEKQVEIVNA
jgi:copper chaperone CopZ